MLKRRLIPKLQLGLRRSYRGTQPVLLITRQFSEKRPIGDPLSQAKIYESQLVDELILVDLERTDESWSVLLNTIQLMSEQLATPLSVGGGLQNFDQVQALLDRGADKVILNSAAVSSPELINQVANAYGQQCVVLSVDCRYNCDGMYGVWTACGTHDVGLEPLKWAKEGVERGAGEVMVTSIIRDGSGLGLDLDLISEFSCALPVPVIASGGCGLAQHFVEGYIAGASAVSAGTFFSQRDQNPMQCRSHIRNAGFPIRLEV